MNIFYKILINTCFLVLFFFAGFKSHELMVKKPLQVVEAPEIDKRFNYDKSYFLIRIFEYDTIQDLQDMHDKIIPTDDRVTAFSLAGYAYDQGSAVWCDLHVPKVLTLSDKNFWVWGHELRHCIYGSYHK